MGYLNVQREPEQSQLSKTNTGALERNRQTRTRPIERPHSMARHSAPDRAMPQGRKWKTGLLNVHKARGWSQLSKTDTGALE